VTKPDSRHGRQEARRKDVIEGGSVASERNRVDSQGLTMPLPALIDVEMLARYLGVTVHHVRRLVQERRIPHLKVGVFVRFDPQEVACWLEERRVPEYQKRQVRLREQLQ
jgi:excisionase family DNA binding protein